MAACVAKTSAACVKRVKVPVEPSTEASLVAASLGTSDFCEEKMMLGATEIKQIRCLSPYIYIHINTYIIYIQYIYIYINQIIL